MSSFVFPDEESLLNFILNYEAHKAKKFLTANRINPTPQIVNQHKVSCALLANEWIKEYEANPNVR